MRTLNICFIIMLFLTGESQSHEIEGWYEIRYSKKGIEYFETNDYAASLELIGRDAGEEYLLSVSSANGDFKTKLKLGPNVKYWPRIEKIAKVGFCEQAAYRQYLVVDLREPYRGDIWGVGYHRLVFDLHSGELSAQFYDERSSQMGGLLPAGQLSLLYDINCENGLEFSAKPAEVLTDGGIIPPLLD